MLASADVNDLESYFGGEAAGSGGSGEYGMGAGPSGIVSSLGEQLERARVLYRDCYHQIIPPAGRMGEEICEDEDGYQYKRIVPWPHAFVKETRPPPPGVLPSHRSNDKIDASERHQIEQAHEANRRRRERRQRTEARLGRLPQEAYAALRALYGPEGQHWKQTPRGRAWALLPLTALGRRQLAKEGADPWAWLCDLAKRTGVDWLDAAIDQAERLEGEAERAWKKTAPKTTEQPADESLGGDFVGPGGT